MWVGLQGDDSHFTLSRWLRESPVYLARVPSEVCGVEGSGVWVTVAAGAAGGDPEIEFRMTLALVLY